MSSDPNLTELPYTMSADKSLLSYRLKILGDDIRVMWRPIKQKITDQMYDLALLKNFFKTWEDSVKSGASAQEGYNKAISELPKDNPTTQFLDETVTVDQLKEKFEFFFHKPIENATAYDAESLEKNITALTEQVKTFIAKGMFVDSEIDSTQREIDNLKSILNAAADDGEAK